MQVMLRQAGQRKQMVVEIQSEIAQLEQQKKELQDYKAVQLSGMPSGNGSFDGIGNKIVQMESLEGLIQQTIFNIEKEMAQTTILILRSLHPRHQRTKNFPFIQRRRHWFLYTW